MAEPMTNIISLVSNTERPLTILTVEDSRLERFFLENKIREMGYNYLEAENGEDALKILQNSRNQVDVIVMDRMMPVLDGVTTVRRIKEDDRLRKIPIIMVTGAGGVKDIEEGLAAGVFYYLSKPVEPDVLKSVLLAASREALQTRTLSDELKKHRTSFNLIQSCKFKLSTLDEAECLAAFMAHCFPEPERVLQGLAELLINAVEHGIYKIGYQRKSELISMGTWRSEIERRQKMDEYKDMFVEAVFSRKENGTYVVISDPGPGFDWQRYMKIDPARSGDAHGRGIAQANAISFDKLTFNETGNQAIAFVDKNISLRW